MVRPEIVALLGTALLPLAHAQSYNYTNGTNVNSTLAGALYKDASQPVEIRVDDLLSRMTLDEKVAQLMQGTIIYSCLFAILKSEPPA